MKQYTIYDNSYKQESLKNDGYFSKENFFNEKHIRLQFYFDLNMAFLVKNTNIVILYLAMQMFKVCMYDNNSC